MLTLIRAGLYTSVQDAGRFGMRQSGVSYCGALDRPALEIANVLVGNPGSTAALEITLGQCVIEFGQETWFALTGAGCEATLDGKAVWTGWRLRAKAGQRLTLKRPLHGVRSYLAVAGGIDVPEVLGSSSTDQKAGIGGHEGRLLRDGDRLAIKPSARHFSTTQGVNSCCGETRSAPYRGRNIMNLTRRLKSPSGARRGSSARRVTVWATACRGSR